MLEDIKDSNKDVNSNLSNKTETITNIGASKNSILSKINSLALSQENNNSLMKMAEIAKQLNKLSQDSEEQEVYRKYHKVSKCFNSSILQSSTYKNSNIDDSKENSNYFCPRSQESPVNTSSNNIININFYNSFNNKEINNINIIDKKSKFFGKVKEKKDKRKDKINNKTESNLNKDDFYSNNTIKDKNNSKSVIDVNNVNNYNNASEHNNAVCTYNCSFKWKRKEDDKLISLVNDYLKNNRLEKLPLNDKPYLTKVFKSLSKYLENRSPQQIIKRYKILIRNFKRGAWLPEEDEAIRRLVKELGFKWAIISQFMTSRSAKQIRDRYLNYLDPNLNNQKFTDEEDNKIMEIYSNYGPIWTEMSVYFIGRTGDMIKKRFYSCLKKKKYPEYYSNIKSKGIVLFNINPNLKPSLNLNTQEPEKLKANNNNYLSKTRKVNQLALEKLIQSSDKSKDIKFIVFKKRQEGDSINELCNNLTNEINNNDKSNKLLKKKRQHIKFHNKNYNNITNNNISDNTMDLLNKQDSIFDYNNYVNENNIPYDNNNITETNNNLLLKEHTAMNVINFTIDSIEKNEKDKEINNFIKLILKLKEQSNLRINNEINNKNIKEEYLINSNPCNNLLSRAIESINNNNNENSISFRNHSQENNLMMTNKSNNINDNINYNNYHYSMETNERNNVFNLKAKNLINPYKYEDKCKDYFNVILQETLKDFNNKKSALIKSLELNKTFSSEVVKAKDININNKIVSPINESFKKLKEFINKK